MSSPEPAGLVAGGTDRCGRLVTDDVVADNITVADTTIGGKLIGIQLHQGDSDAAQRTLDQVSARVEPYPQEAMTALADLQARIDAARQPPPIPIP